MSRPTQGFDQAVFTCGRCGARRTTRTEADYIKAVSAHRDAHSVFDRLDPIERDGMGSILRVLLHDVTLATELLALITADQDHTTGHQP
ncbi:hypothetical protein [Streptomyces sp. NPDC085479]|uniref:hypothetical protein n=1 Tax=Streptomyces sp. NPDC085479 TaxID=3365726 RepID=UPI0037D92CFC